MFKEKKHKITIERERERVKLSFLKSFFITAFFVAAIFLYLPNHSSAAVSFSQDTSLSLTGVSDGDITAASGSSADYLSFSGAELTISAIPDGSYFTLKTPTYSNALKITPSGGTATTTFNSANLSSGAVTAWTINASASNTTIAHIVSAASANSWYAIAVDGSAYNSYQTGSNGELSFTYSGGFSSSHTFTISSDTAAPTSFSLTSPVNGAIVSTGLPTFTWNASTAPDLSYYALYIDGALNANNLTSTSKTITSSIACGSHAWYVKAVDSAGNSTDSSAFNLTVACGGGSPGAVSAALPQPRLQTVYPDGTIVYQDQEQVKNAGQSQTSNPALNNPTAVQPPVSFFFTKLFKINSKNSEVKNLQRALNSLGFTVAQQGPGAKGNETDYYGKATREAVKKFQCKHNIICQGNENTTGWGTLGPKTRAKLNEMTNGQTNREQPKEQTKQDQAPPSFPPNRQSNASAIAAAQKQIEEMQNQLLELLNKQLKELTN